MEFFDGKTALVAGGAGFIGQHLCRALLNAGARVHVVDNFSTGTGHVPDGVTVDRQDVSIIRDFRAADVIFNLASPASPIHYQADPIQTWKTNVLGAMHLLEHAMACKATLVQASTSEVYGDPLAHPQVETDWGNVNPIGPRACYDESKRAAESLLMDAVRTQNADIRIARIFNTYGPGMEIEDGRAVPNFMAQAKAGQVMTVHGDGTQTRSFCYVDDTVQGLMRLGAIDAARGEVFNIGNPNEISVAELADQINQACGNKSRVEFTQRPIDDPTRRCPNIAKAKQLLGWEPTIGLADGLGRTLGSGPIDPKVSDLFHLA
ncbi:NAD-dependent epimerase/dehydratase family protein [Yoonia sp. BS5-3]|uniref:NAD-dependent epimerase/dehydratase family protein n=1 Tax=Yoonia phaeophyticola TaxID=3137369 RepID=A0ABZ2V6K1_9RHOB